jgi:hypothetical protein
MISVDQPLPECRRQPEIEKSRTGDGGFRHIRIAGKLRRNLLCKCPRVHPQLLGQHHGRIGRDIAMGGIARRLDREPFEVEIVGLFA